MKQPEIAVIETREAERDYGFGGVEAIIDHPEHGKVFLADGYGGEQDLEGGAVRWKHGLAVKLLPGDTLDSLEAAEWNDSTTVKQAMLNGYDNQRPVLDWCGYVVATVAKAAGL